MNVRLIKARMSPPEEKHNQLSVEVPIIDTIRSWVRDFQSTRANRARSDFEQLNNSRKT